MKTLPEFFQGSIAQNLQDILDADHALVAAPGELASEAKKKKKKKKTSSHRGTGAGCTRPDRCPPKKKKKADSFMPGVPGWSSPPAPPAS